MGFIGKLHRSKTDKAWVLASRAHLLIQNTMDLKRLTVPILLNWSEIALILGVAGIQESARISSSLPIHYSFITLVILSDCSVPRVFRFLVA
jgi:hypothetical protein